MKLSSDERLDRTFHALAHPTRRAILSRLAARGGASVSELAEPFGVSLMAISKHVGVMERAGLLSREKDGRVTRCTFEPAAVNEADAWIRKHQRFWERQLDSLADYMDGGAAAPDDERE